jgi:6-phosphofructokinase 1
LRGALIMAAQPKKSIGVLTSGGDAPGMNAAVRAVVRTGLARGVIVYAIYEGYQGMVEGGDRIRKMTWESVGGILQQGGTVIGTARSAAFRTREGRRQAAYNLLNQGIDGLVVIGGDGSLTGANAFRQEWPELLAELVAQGAISQDIADAHPNMAIVGLVGSIDNDMFGTDMTIGADTALHRITEAIDALASTAASHQRTFVIEVMGRRCGYLALMAALGTGGDYIFIPENPPEEGWEDQMCDLLKAGRAAGRRDIIVIVAEGAQDRQGNPITCDYIKTALEDRLGVDTRITILGHVQRGGSPSAYDRILSTLMGYAAVDELLAAGPESVPQLIGTRGHRISRAPLMECVQKTLAVNEAIKAHDYETAMSLRGPGFKRSFERLQTLMQALPHPPASKQKRLRLAVLNAGGVAPGMNTAVRAAVRLGLNIGHIMLGVHRGIQGLIDGELQEMNWMSVAGWAPRGGSELGTSRKVPGGRDFYAIARQIEEHKLDGILMIGGWVAYQSAYELFKEREKFPAFNIPIVCLPASINNDLPGTDQSVGSDSALNSIVEAVDKIKQSAVASNRCFVVEVMGRHCGYLALMSGLATGAERVYTHEEGVTLRELQTDVTQLIKSFEEGKRVGLMIRNERANPLYTTEFMSALFEEEGGALFDVRRAILGHLQQGGDPSPYDRLQATRMAAECVDFMVGEVGKESPGAVFIGLQGGRLKFHNLEDFPRMVDMEHKRPKEQSWLAMQEIVRILAQPEK